MIPAGIPSPTKADEVSVSVTPEYSPVSPHEPADAASSPSQPQQLGRLLMGRAKRGVATGAAAGDPGRQQKRARNGAAPAGHHEAGPSGPAAAKAAEKPALAAPGTMTMTRVNPRSDLFTVTRFHHVEFWGTDASTAAHRFSSGLGMPRVALSDLSTGNPLYASHVLQSGDLVFAFTAPYAHPLAATPSEPAVGCGPPLRHFDRKAASAFAVAHGLGVRAIGIAVADADAAFSAAVSRGGRPAMAPETLVAPDGTAQRVAELELYGDVVLRLVGPPPAPAAPFRGPFLAGYASVPRPGGGVPGGAGLGSMGLTRLDHAVGNVPVLAAAVGYIRGMTGFHDFAEFSAADVGTADSGLNSHVLASNNERVLLPVNEPTFGTARPSQIQTFLDHHGGPGLQHLALKTDDAIATLRAMRAAPGAFEFMPPPGAGYYRRLPGRLGPGALTETQLAACEELGLLADRDDRGVLLQVFTKPVGDRPTLFLEIIQRIGCMVPAETADADAGAAKPAGKGRAAKGRGKAARAEPAMEQAGGCGGFGKGNFSELFKSIEDYERTLAP